VYLDFPCQKKYLRLREILREELQQRSGKEAPGFQAGDELPAAAAALLKRCPLAGEDEKCGLVFIARDGWHPFPHKVMVASTNLSEGLTLTALHRPRFAV
jgi:hypothetical protein